MDFNKGQKVQAIDRLGRWEDARILDCDIENFHVNFIGWGMPVNKMKSRFSSFLYHFQNLKWLLNAVSPKDQHKTYCIYYREYTCLNLEPKLSVGPHMMW